MLKYFQNCKTVAELNERKTEILQDLNKEYQLAKGEVLKALPPYQRVNLIRATDVTQVVVPTITAFTISREPAPSDTIIINSNGSMQI